MFFEKMDGCTFSIQYPTSIEKLVSDSANEEVAPHHRWVTPGTSWADMYSLCALTARPFTLENEQRLREGMPAGELLVAGLEYAERAIRDESPEEWEEFCGLVEAEAFHGMPVTRLDKAIFQFKGPLWACAGAARTAERYAPLVVMGGADNGYRVLASQDPRMAVGSMVSIKDTIPAVTEFRPVERPRWNS